MLSFGCAAPEKKPPSREALLEQAEADLEQGHFHKALTKLNAVLNTDPHNVQVHLDLGWAYVYSEQYDKALAEIKTIEGLEPRNKAVYHLKGVLYHRLEQWGDALEAYEKALDADINNAELHHDVAEAFMALNSPEEALVEYGIASRLEPENPNYAFGKCVAHRQMKQYDQAIVSCESALLAMKGSPQEGRVQEVLESIKLLQVLEEDSLSETGKQ